MPPWTVPWIFTLMLLLSCLPGLAQAKYAYGARRSGKKLVGPPVLEEHHAKGPLQCLSLCGSLGTCQSLNFNTVTTSINCHLFEERACLGHELVTDPDVNYYDVYDEPTTERQLPFWDHPVCTEDGYCSPDCAAENVGDACIGDGHCISQSMAPPGAYACKDSTCQLADDFWEVRPGLAMPRWMDWVLNPWVMTYKKIEAGTCALNVTLKLGVGATVELKLVASQRESETRLQFNIGLEATDLLFYNDSQYDSEYESAYANEFGGEPEYGNSYGDNFMGSEFPVVSGANTTGMVNTETFTQLKISWCDGAMAIGPTDNPILVSGQVNEVEEIVYLAGTSSGPESYLQVDSGVADSWLFDEEGTDPDPVFTFGDTMIERKIEPSVDVTVKYDCMTTTYCSVYFRSVYPHMLTVEIGGYSSDDLFYAIAYNDSRSTPWLMADYTGPVVSATDFNTFTVRYNDGKVTVFRNDDAEAIYDVTAPTLLPPITSVAIGNMIGAVGWTSVRVARYDPAWRTDTWETDGAGFSNMDANLRSP